MTRQRLIANVIAVMSVFAALIIVALIAKVWFQSTYWYDFIKDFSALFIAIGAAYLAYCFQQRQAFLFALRELWEEIVKAKTRVNHYANHMHPDPDAYHRAYRSLSKAIDLVRGVYMNVGEDQSRIGFYPFEPLHDIRKCMEALGYREIDDDEKSQYVELIDHGWNALRFAFLREFDRPPAAYPIVERLFRDPRRHG